MRFVSQLHDVNRSDVLHSYVKVRNRCFLTILYDNSVLKTKSGSFRVVIIHEL